MPSIDVKQAVRIALEYVREIFDSDKLSHLGLEEVERLGGTWLVTVGFSRPWDYPRHDALSSLHPLAQLRDPDKRPDRDYKLVRIDAETGEVESVKNRD